MKNYLDTINQEVIEYFNIKHSKYTGFDFDFKPYEM